MEKRKVRLIPFVVGIDPRVLQDAVKEIETAERDILKVKTLFKDGLITPMSQMAEFIKTYGGVVTNYLPDEHIIDFNYGNICITAHGEKDESAPADSKKFLGGFFKWVVSTDNYVELWDLHNVCKLKEQFPISWDCLLEQACPSTCTFNHSDTKHNNAPTLQGFEIVLYEGG